MAVTFLLAGAVWFVGFPCGLALVALSAACKRVRELETCVSRVQGRGRGRGCDVGQRNTLLAAEGLSLGAAAGWDGRLREMDFRLRRTMELGAVPELRCERGVWGPGRSCLRVGVWEEAPCTRQVCQRQRRGTCKAGQLRSFVFPST